MRPGSVFGDVQHALDGRPRPSLFVQPIFEHFTEEGIQGGIAFSGEDPRGADQLRWKADRDISRFHTISVILNP